MTGNKCLLDTSVVIHSFKKNNAIGEQLDTIAEIYVPVTVIVELYYGAYKSSNPLKHISQIQSFLINCKILLPDAATADAYGNIKAALIKKGKPIPENDIWIAAIACQYNLPLFTTDHHFSEIDNISLLK
jgi:tRNA(fMet)-specific endonuclease VapC